MHTSILQTLLGLCLSWKQKFESTRVGKVWLLLAAKRKAAKPFIAALTLSFAALLGAMCMYKFSQAAQGQQGSLVEASLVMYVCALPFVLRVLCADVRSGILTLNIDGSGSVRILGIPAHRAYLYEAIIAVIEFIDLTLNWLGSWGWIAWMPLDLPILPDLVEKGLWCAWLLGLAAAWRSVVNDARLRSNR